ncbi:MAG TPA: ECF-type sigma factor [Gemmataceae bacterium]|jgi:RNA polymerase sigma factor (TIGR02999 family)|nr:ECF-type sigma factor [Gemmataceae bacterium]
MDDITNILGAIEQGDSAASDRLFTVVYEELRRLAEGKMSREKPGQTLDATALVHEVYLRLVDVVKARRWQNRGHFFSAAAEAMRHILVERARHKHAQKRGAGRTRVPFDESRIAAEDELEVLSVNEALAGLAAVDAHAAELVKLRYFAGLSIPDAAQVLNIGARSADRLWTFARAWLRRAIETP